MNKQIITGLLAGAILGVLEMFLFNGGYELIVVPAILGAVIGYLSTQSIKLNAYIAGAIAGALFFIIVAAKSGLWLDDIVTGAITGAVIVFIVKMLNKSSVA